MNRKFRKAFMVIIGVLAVLIILGMIVLGINLYKNRWHRINFTIDSINVIKNDNYGEYKYHAVVVGSAKTWFYDFNTYEFNLTQSADGDIAPSNVENSSLIVANHKDNGKFKFSFETDDISEIGSYVFKAENIFIDGNEKKGTDIRLFMSEYKDKIKEVKGD